MKDTVRADICVIGAGSAGLSIAAGASQMGARTVLIEKGAMGGDCLNTGCVPSKALLVAAKAAAVHRRTGALGVHYDAPRVDFRAVHDHVHGVIAAIAPMDSVERFEGLGVTVIRGAARFVGPRELEVERTEGPEGPESTGGTRVRARRFVLATGSRPLVPPIPGLEAVDYLTNETVFGLSERPEHLIVIGGGPIGCELGQAFRLLGARVSLVEMAGLLPKDDPELVAVLRKRLRADGIALHEGAKVVGVARSGPEKTAGVTLEIEREGARESLEGSTLLLAAGRAPALEGLGLEAAGIEYDRRGLKVDGRLRTSNPRVYAAGDAAGSLQFTHVAGYHAGIVIKNALFRLPAKAEVSAVPWVTYTAPELAHVGLSEEAARQAHGRVNILRWPFAENDRAQAERACDGMVKAVTKPNGKILGASIVGSQAGELIQPWVLAISQGLKIGAMAQAIAPYPTLGEASKRAAGSYFVPKLFGPRTKWLVRQLARLG